jgi:hypothetical protein
MLRHGFLISLCLNDVSATVGCLRSFCLASISTQCTGCILSVYVRVHSVYLYIHSVYRDMYAQWMAIYAQWMDIYAQCIPYTWRRLKNVDNGQNLESRSQTGGNEHTSVSVHLPDTPSGTLGQPPPERVLQCITVHSHVRIPRKPVGYNT